MPLTCASLPLLVLPWAQILSGLVYLNTKPRSVIHYDLKPANILFDAHGECKITVRGREQEGAFVDEMRQFAARLVAQVKASNAAYRHDNQTRTPCPDCGKYLLRVKTKRGEMLVCPDRECGYRRSVKQTTNARCPNCHKRMELRGEGEKQLFACVCGYREKLSDFKKRRAQKSAGKGDVRRYLAQQEQREEKGSSALAEQLAKWMAQQKGN